MDKPRPKTFNTVGICLPAKHYMLPVLPRIPDVDDMVEGEFYFVLHAPRQSGKTTFLKALTDKINSDGRYYALYCSLEASQGVVDIETAMRQIVVEINRTLKKSPIISFNQLAVPGIPLAELDASEKVSEMLNYLSVNLDKDLVVFFDEADCLSNSGPLITFLRQIRIGYNNRSDSESSKFPRSMALVGMRDIRDYLVQVRPDDESKGVASPFNIKKESLTLANFTLGEIQTLYSQHTEATGQKFTDEAIDQAWYWTEGQPWLVNALAYEVVVKQLKNDYASVISGLNLDQAAEALIKRRETHIDSLLARLQEPRVRRIMEAVIKGDPFFPSSVLDDDIEYTLDLGLLKKQQSSYLPSNPIYKEVILRTLTYRIQESIPESYKNRWMDGKTLDMTSLLKAFQEYWRENSGILPDPYGYTESMAHLVFFAFSQRVLNGGAEFIKREYALGSCRVDVCIGYKGRKYPIELKIKGHKSFAESLEQEWKYIDISGASEGWLVIFDRSEDKIWDDKITWETQEYKGKTIHVVGC
jgi:hypothetical protein